MLKNADTASSREQWKPGDSAPFPISGAQPSTTPSPSLDKPICHSFYKIYFTFPWLRTHKSYFKATFIRVASDIEHLLIKWLGTSELHCT